MQLCSITTYFCLSLIKRVTRFQIESIVPGCFLTGEIPKKMRIFFKFQGRDFLRDAHLVFLSSASRRNKMRCYFYFRPKVYQNAPFNLEKQ